MLRYVYGHDLNKFPLLAETMFRDRACQFANRLGWEVTVDDHGHERDQYDVLDPLYVIWEMPDGTHGGSMRFLPTTGPTMINEHFTHIIGGGTIVSPLIWESTRYCLKQGAPSNIASALMLGAGEVMQGFGLVNFVGVFDARMVRIYRAIGAAPEVIGSQGEGRDQISVGLWSYFTDEGLAKATRKAGVTREQSRIWFDASFGGGFNGIAEPLRAIA